MSEFKNKVIHLAADLEQKADDFLLRLKKKLKLSDPLHIVAYRSYGTASSLYVKGRVLENKNHDATPEKEGLLHHLVQMYHRFETDEVSGATLSVCFESREHTLQSDKEGYFVQRLSPALPLTAETMWHEVEIELKDAPLPFEPGIKSKAHVLVPPVDAEYGIISDIDDTIIQTGATHFLTMSRNTFFRNARTRLPFAGVSEFYKALQLGRNGKRNNPFFYVSSSPWNLYDLLTDFMDFNDIPAGPLLLRDFGLHRNELSGKGGHLGHKMKEIEQILNAYPQLPFVLVGDSGQEDPAIYREVVRKFPGRILAVYIRDVQLADREKIAMDIAKDLVQDKVEMVIVDNTVEAAEHAAKMGLIYTESLPEIVEDKKQDKGEVKGKEGEVEE